MSRVGDKKANKITEILVEPNKLKVGSTFKLKIKAIRYMTCEEMKTKTCAESSKWKCKEVAGE